MIVRSLAAFGALLLTASLFVARQEAPIGISDHPYQRGVAQLQGTTQSTTSGASLSSSGTTARAELMTRAVGGTVPDGPCAFFRFDEFGDGLALGTYTMTNVIDISFGPNWLTLVDADDGGSGRIANEPSSPAVAYFLDPAGSIDFSDPIGYFAFSYSASSMSLPLTVRGWSGLGGTGTLLAEATGSILGASFDGANCSGDPNGEFCLWGTVAVQAPNYDIRSVTIEGVGNQFGIDDLQVCAFGPCEDPASLVALDDPMGLNVPNSLVFDPTVPPSVGSSDFFLTVQDPLGTCGVAPGALTQVIVTTGLASNQLWPGFGCNGGLGDVRLDFSTTFYTSPFRIWTGSPLVHPIPIPAVPELCGEPCTAQAMFLDRSGPTPVARITNAILLTLGY